MVATLFTAVFAMAILLLGLAGLLVIADRWFAVIEDPRIEIVESMLPATNCGGCGHPGCRAFAEALVAGAAEPAGCAVSPPSEQARIAEFLGVAVGSIEKRVARLACAGGDNVAPRRARYRGLRSCAAAALVAGGGKSCFWGCLGLADCQTACTFAAIAMDNYQLPVVDPQKCTACGDCVVACPKDLFSLQAIGNRLWVACRSRDAGDQVLEECRVGCTACGRCALDAPDHVRMVGNLPVVNYDRGNLSPLATQRCPTGAILWLDDDLGPIKGRAAAPVLRRTPLPDVAS